MKALEELTAEIRETWKDIPLFEGYYQASDLGRIRSIDRIVKYKDGREGMYKGQIIKQRVNKVGYLMLSLSIGSKIKTFTVHRLIALTFIPNPENKPEVNHINGKHIDNKLENLEWVTPKENTQHAIRTGLINNIGSNHYNYKLSDSDVIEIRKSNLSQKELSIKFNVSDSYISVLKSNKKRKTNPRN